MTSQLTGFDFIPERSQATPGLWNRVFSQLSDNIGAVNQSVGGLSGDTITASGQTIHLQTNLDVVGQVHAQGLSLGSTPPSQVTTVAITVAVNSASSDYLYLTDSSGARSSYVIGSRAGGTADGLNIWDASGSTLLVSFSKQSIRFFQNVVGPVFDVGGALADTLNAATFGTASDSIESRIQAAISAATLTGITRVYVPASMFPYSAQSISHDTRLQMAREGGDQSVFDVVAYGANGNGSTGSAAGNSNAIQSAISAANADPHKNGLGGGVVFFPAGRYAHDKTIRLPIVTNSGQVILRGTGERVSYLYPLQSCQTGVLVGTATPDPSGTVTNQTLLEGIEDLSLSGSLTTDTFTAVQFTEVQKGWMRNNLIDGFTQGDSVGLFLLGSTTAGVGASAAPHNWRCGFTNVWVTATVNPLRLRNVEENDFYNCNFNADVGRASATTAMLFQQGRNNRFFGLLVGGESSSITTGRPNYAGAVFQAPANGNNEGHQFYGVFAEGFDSALSLATPNAGGPQNLLISGYGSSTNRQEISDSAANRTTFVDTGGLAVPLFQYIDGTAAGPSYAFRSEGSLGWYRSGTSIMALAPTGRMLVGSTAAFSLTTQPEYGFGGEPQLGFRRSGASAIDPIAGNVRIGRFGVAGGLGFIGIELGSSTSPSLQFNNEPKLGFYRSGASTTALSYGTIDLTGGGAVASLASITVKSGANNSCGTAVLGSNGSVNVANTYVKTGDLVILTDQTAGGTLGVISLGGIRNSSGFTILSSNVADTSTVAWLIVRPG